jgi:flavin reductase (DIM6/NTAB) family NADH-FMN oxidoreductase RutF
MDNAALFKISYGLYVLTAKGEQKDNGCIINTLMQVASTPEIVGVIAVNKQNFTHDLIRQTKEFNVSCLSVATPFEVFQNFGFQSGKTADKFAAYQDFARSENGIIYLNKYSNSYLSFQVRDTIDFGTHTMFKAVITDGKVLNDTESVTYAYYQQNIKPKPQARQKGYRCGICNYLYENDILPAEFICPICKHGASDFVKL